MKAPIYLNDSKINIRKSGKNIILIKQGRKTFLNLDSISYIIKFNNNEIPHNVFNLLFEKKILLFIASYGGKSIGVFTPLNHINDIERKQYETYYDLEKREFLIKEIKKISKYNLKIQEKKKILKKDIKLKKLIVMKEFCYYLLKCEIIGHIFSQCLSLNRGFIQDSLVDDLFLIFHPLIDSMLIALVNRREIKKEYFNEKENICMMSNEGKLFLEKKFIQLMDKSKYDVVLDSQITYREIIRKEVIKLKRFFIEGEIYEGKKIK